MIQYFLCRNPLSVSPIGIEEYIFSSQKPRFFAGLLELDPDTPIADMDYEGCNTFFKYTTANGVARCFVLIASQNIDRTTDQKLTLLLKDAAKYYVCCLNEQDIKQHGKQGAWRVGEAYNNYMPDVWLAQNEKHGNFLVGYIDGIRTLSSFEDVKEYMHRVLGYDERVVKGGMVNTF